MMKTLAQKMDELESWNVLAKPEDLGITPVFCSPSMLVPKETKGEYRLVTDFSNINNHIKKIPSLLPTIEETKIKIAKYNYVVCIDLSNFYFQHAVPFDDIKYLATPHPFKGMRVYQVQPQGIKNASENCGERLSRIFGDLCQEDNMCIHADGLYVGGDNLEEVFVNLTEVFTRLRNSGMTIKPSKLVICPRSVTLFGWKLTDGGWSPLPHKVSPLKDTPLPKTVKMLRSFLGSYKQLSSCIAEYAVTLSPLEKIVGGKSSAENINWTEELTSTFNKAKESLKHLDSVHIPKPTDQIITYSDFSQSNSAVGGRMEIKRTLPDGKIKFFHGGFFSAKIPPTKSRWICCE